MRPSVRRLGHHRTAVLASAVCLLVALLACKKQAENACGSGQVNLDGKCWACPVGAEHRESEQRLSGRTSGASIRESWCEQNGKRVGPYARWSEAKYFLSGGMYDAGGQKHGPWTEWPSYGYGGYQQTGSYQHGKREGCWVRYDHGRRLDDDMYRDGQLAAPSCD